MKKAVVHSHLAKSRTESVLSVLPGRHCELLVLPSLDVVCPDAQEAQFIAVSMSL